MPRCKSHCLRALLTFFGPSLLHNQVLNAEPLKKSLTTAYTLLRALTLSVMADASGLKALEFEALGSIEGTDKWDWWQARTAFVPGDDPLWITTMSETGKGVSHDFHDVYQSLSRDGGRTWSKPALIKSLQRMRQPDGFEVAPGDLWPTWHAKSGKVLTTGKTFNFAKGKDEKHLLEKVSYAVADPLTKTWGPMKFFTMPEKDHSGRKIVACNAGNNQRVDLPNGEILLPVRYVADVQKHNYTSAVARCRFDGETLTYLDHGTELNIPQGRGLYEPSLTEFEGRFFLTLRADHSAYVKLRRWTEVRSGP